MEEGVKGSRLIQPRGLKSQSAFLNTLNPTVEAYTASWIEILRCWNLQTAGTSRLIQPRGLKSPYNIIIPRIARSRLIQPRGLKFYKTVQITRIFPVEAYTASWIEI